MEAAENWKQFFADWPESLPRNGIVVTVLNEAMPFKKFYLKGDMLLLERTVPDALGARFLLLGFEVINAVKITSPLTADAVSQAGFAESAATTMQAAY